MNATHGNGTDFSGDEIDLLVVGGGPGGATLAALVARAGFKVTVFDRLPFPRFHVGESLLPIDLPLFERLGVDVKGPGFLLKGGADFHDEARGLHSSFSFSKGLPGTQEHAYQVRRADFDHQLLQIAERDGAKLEMGERVRSFSEVEGGLAVLTDSGRAFKTRYLVDATGQDAWLARQNRTLETIKDFGRAAVFGHHGELDNKLWGDLAENGHIRIMIVKDGWAWVIPLPDRQVSIGLVSRLPGLAPEALTEFIAASPMLSKLTATGRRMNDPTMYRNFSYRNTRARGPRWCCIGDAGMFLDPVFSTGVSLAMLGAERLADLLVEALPAGREAGSDFAKPIADHMHRAYVSFASLIWSFYNTNLVDNFFFAKNPRPDIRAGIVTLLSGDAWRADNPFQEMLLNSDRRRFDPTIANKATDAVAPV
jgi:flavin-dependent dehydrogenase